MSGMMSIVACQFCRTWIYVRNCSECMV